MSSELSRERSEHVTAVRDFRDLEIYKIAREIIKLVYQIVEYLPKEEKYISGRHLKETAQSLAANIAEAWGAVSFQGPN